MIRTTNIRGNGEPRRLSPRQMQVMVELAGSVIDRAMFAERMGSQYGGKRDVYSSLGYPKMLSWDDYITHYERQDIARAIIDRPVTATWSGQVGLLESNDDKDTALEKQYRELDDRLSLKRRFVQVDKLAGIGEYAILLLGLSDTQKREDFTRPARKGAKLLYITPFSQNSAGVVSYESHSANRRYGLPTVYEITAKNVESSSYAEFRVHHTRVVHVVGDSLESDVHGTPRLKPVFNRLIDLEKLVGGSAEMFWRGARPGYSGNLDPEYKLTDEERDKLKVQISEYEHDLRRMLLNEGVNWEALAQQVSDPKSHVDVNLQMISAQTGIPKRILTGSERGELASSEDRGEWLSFIQSRREEYAEPRIVRLFVDHCVELGILPKAVEKYDVQWSDLFAIGEKERSEIGKTRSEALSKYAGTPGTDLYIPPSAFMRYIMMLKDEDIELIQEELEQYRKETELEEQVTEEEEQIIEETEE